MPTGTELRQPRVQSAHIPLQQRLQELQKATGMTKAELAQAVRDWGLSG
ncbi:hypothetical protein [Streptomyces sp. WG7]